jgi:phosphatidylinositol N-acetylglucosaminyltransferase subunit A
MANGMKCYHLPQIPVISGDVAFFSFWYSFPIIRQILIREQIDICHGHSSTSVIQQTVLMAAKLYGIKTVFTEHSLFGFHDMAGINLNKLLKWALRDLDAAICVSNACKENFCLRTKFNPNACFTIPNAVDSLRFYPGEPKSKIETINIVYVSRLQYRKGVDLLIGLIP